MSSLTQAVNTIQSVPTNLIPTAFNAHAASATSVAATQFKGDANLKLTNHNALCVTYIASDKSIPRDGVIKECGKENSGEVCVPPGTIALACNPDMINSGVNVGGGNFQLEPSFIAVPQSEVKQIVEGMNSCYGPHPQSASQQRYAYVKTSIHVGLNDNNRPPQML